MDTLFRGGTVVTDGLEFQADLGVTDGKVSHLGLDLKGDSKTEEVDVRGSYLLPGAVELLADVPAFAPTPDEAVWQSVTGLAAMGGVTSVVVPWEPARGRPLRESLTSLREWAEANAFVDFGVHLNPGNSPDDETPKAWIREAAGVGIPSLWVDVDPDSRTAATFAANLLDWLRESPNGTMIVAPLWDPILARKSKPESALRISAPASPPVAPTAPGFPSWIETQAVERSAAMASFASGCSLLLRSIAGRGALEALKRAREQGTRLFAAAALPLLIADYDTAAPGTACVAPPPAWPPPRGKSDQALLWFLVDEGVIPVVTTHSGCLRGKAAVAGPNGVAEESSRSSTELLALLWPLLYTEGTAKGRLALGALSQAASSDPAKLAGLYPNKGSLLIGADADIVVFNPEVEWSVGGNGDADDEGTEGAGETAQGTDTDADTPGPLGLLAGRRLQGAVERVYLRGRALVVDLEMTAEPGGGRFLERRAQPG